MASEPKEIKRGIFFAVTGLALVVTGYFVGSAFKHAKSGYHHEVRDTKDYDSPVGPVRWSCVTESVGTPLLDSGTTILEIEGRTI